jgi:glyoxylase-like metal-dependent hydrolase (beta-lactamase superfamily II)
MDVAHPLPMHSTLLAALCLVSLGMVLPQSQAAGPPWKVAGGFSMDWDNLKIEVQPLAPNVYFLHGSGGNTVALVGPEGSLLVDTEFAPVAPKLKAALASLGAGPTRYVISTHFHSDHTGGNAFFIKEGAIVIAQTQCRARLLTSEYSPFWGSHSPATPPEEAPTLTYENSLTLHFDGEEVTASHLQPSHTDGDTVVFFKKANVVHLGDIYINGLYPYVDVAAKGTIDGYFPELDDVLSKTDSKSIIIAGHGPISNRSELQAYRDMLWVVRNRVSAMIAQGKTLEEIIAARPSREYDDAWASNRVGPDGFAAVIYQSLTGLRLDWHSGS